ncbi:MAG: NAD(P)H-binding protein [Desulfatitalea sp.]|nr:NAD(P)H-binding protein [Desulfatitalea sp.]
MSKTAIVIGATGLVGQALVDQLAGEDFIGKVVTLTRRPAEHRSAKVHNQVVRFDHLGEHASAFAGDVLFSCLGTTRKQAGSIAAQRTVDVTYQYKAAQLATQQGVRHYLLISSSGANANSGNAYLQMKGELEQRVQSLSFERISIFQPSLLLGARAEPRPGEKLWSWILPPLCAIPGLRRFRPIKGEEVAAKMVQVSQNPGPALEWFRLDEIFLTSDH